MTKNILTTVVSIIFSLIVAETVIRLIHNVSFFPVQNFIAVAVYNNQSNGATSFDELLGWVPKENFNTRRFSTGPFGIRKNNDSKDTLKIHHGGILAVGDSFTWGSEVTNTETWPAHLETLLSEQVYNGGVGGYGTDQIILRGEQLFDILKPRIVIIGFIANDIERAGYESYGGFPKPFFVFENNQLVLKNVPVTKSFEKNHENTFIHSLNKGLGYLYSYALFYSLLDPQYEFYAPNLHVFNDPVAVTCELLGRFKDRLSEQKSKAVLLMQYGGSINKNNIKPPTFATKVTTCASQLGIQVVDEHSILHKIALEDFHEFKALYARGADGVTFGHMSSKGNLLVANLLADQINNQNTGYGEKQASEKNHAFSVFGEFLAGKEKKHFFQPTVADVSLAKTVVTEVKPGEFRFAPTKDLSEHFSTITYSPEEDGDVFLEFKVKNSVGLGSVYELESVDKSVVRLGLDHYSLEYSFSQTGTENSAISQIQKIDDSWVKVSVVVSNKAPPFHFRIKNTFEKNGFLTYFAGSTEHILIKDIFFATLD